MSSYTSPVEKKQKLHKYFVPSSRRSERSPLPVENLISCPSGGAVSLGLHLIPQQNLKTPSRSSSLSRQPCFFFFFFFSFLKIYIFLFVFVLLLLQTVKDKTLIANGCIRKKNGKKNLQKKRTLKKKKNHKKLPSLSL